MSRLTKIQQHFLDSLAEEPECWAECDQSEWRTAVTLRRRGLIEILNFHDGMKPQRFEARMLPGADIRRELAGETVCGFRVAAYRETDPEHGSKYGHRYSEHWSTPSRNPLVKVERLFTESQLRAALAGKGDPA